MSLQAVRLVGPYHISRPELLETDGIAPQKRRSCIATNEPCDFTKEMRTTKMPFKDKNKARKYQREYQRRRRSKVRRARVGLTHSCTSLKTLNDLRIVFERIANDVLDAEDLDLGVKGRVLAQLLKVGKDLIESTDLERRVEALEKRAEHC